MPVSSAEVAYEGPSALSRGRRDTDPWVSNSANRGERMKAPDYLLQRFRPGSWVMAIGDVWRVVECLPDELVRLA